MGYVCVRSAEFAGEIGAVTGERAVIVGDFGVDAVRSDGGQTQPIGAIASR